MTTEDFAKGMYALKPIRYSTRIAHTIKKKTSQQHQYFKDTFSTYKIHKSSSQLALRGQ